VLVLCLSAGPSVTVSVGLSVCLSVYAHILCLDVLSPIAFNSDSTSRTQVVRSPGIEAFLIVEMKSQKLA
jgi:hypothetical protein